MLTWRTRHQIGNAAVMGFIPQVRYILLTDLLLETMSDEQIEAVFAHEMGHVLADHVGEDAHDLVENLAHECPFAVWAATGIAASSDRTARPGCATSSVPSSPVSTVKSTGSSPQIATAQAGPGPSSGR